MRCEMLSDMTSDFYIEPVPVEAREQFCAMAEAYWRDLMPDAEVCKSRESRDSYFLETFTWAVIGISIGCLLGNSRLDLFLLRLKVRLLMFTIFILPRNTVAKDMAKMAGWMFEYFDEKGIRQLDLNVRRDNSNALSFWKAQGLGIAGYRLRMYRDPETGTPYKGVLSSDF